MGSRSSIGFWIVIAVIAIALFLFACAGDSWGDEGFHLTAAMLVSKGKLPYLDFFYQHPPLYPFALAGWMSIFGSNWRSVHLFSALWTFGTALILGIYLRKRLGKSAFGGQAAALGASFAGLTVLVVKFATMAQPYALAMFCSTAALVCAFAKDSLRRAIFSGILSSAAAATSLLTAPLVLVLGIRYLRERSATIQGYLAGVCIGAVPVIWLGVIAPRQMLFDVVTFHMFHRRETGDWDHVNIFRSDLGVITSWLESPQGVLIALLASVGIFTLNGDLDFSSEFREELKSCIPALVALAVLPLVAHPTFEQYYVQLVPILAILGAVGVRAIWHKSLPNVNVWIASAILAAIFFAATLGQLRRSLGVYRMRSQWHQLEAVGEAARKLMPENGRLYTDFGQIYFATGIAPPSGLENSMTHSVRPPPELTDLVKLVPQSKLDEWFRLGRFDVVVTYNTGLTPPQLILETLYLRKDLVTDYIIYSGPKREGYRQSNK